MAFEQLLRQGHKCLEDQEPRQAIPFFMQILQAEPNHVAALAGLAKATLQLNDPATAWQMLEMALTLSPEDPDVLNAAGYAQVALGDYQEAIEKFDAALTLRPDEPGILLNLASAVAGIGAWDRADEIYRRLEAEGRGGATARYNRSLLLLLQGRLAEAWPGFECRRQALNTGLPPRHLPGQPWDGSERPADSLLIHAEQGLGDNIQFVRYLPQVAGRVGRVVLEAPRVLMDLVAGMPGVDQIVPMGDALPECDWHASVMSLPALFGAILETIPADVPYLPVDADATVRWRDKLGQGDSVLRVGLVWAGNPGHGRDRERSVPLRTLAPALAGRNGIRFHAFQIGDPLGQVGDVTDAAEIEILFPEPEPLTEVAAALSAVDLLISVDTALAHLAGALGRPVWTLIAHVPDWRWMLDRADSPWYPTMRLFRQPAPGDWDAVAAAVGQALTADAGKKS